jgi:membrane-associated phospholipid phosphatase
MLLAVGVVLLNTVLKHWWGLTPEFASIFPGAPPDYPSGHTAYVTAVLGYIAVLGHEHRQPEITLVSVLLIVGMGLARVASGAHFVSDVVGGYLLGAGWLILVVLWARPGALERRRLWSGSAREEDPREASSFASR